MKKRMTQSCKLYEIGAWQSFQLLLCALTFDAVTALTHLLKSDKAVMLNCQA